MNRHDEEINHWGKDILASEGMRREHGFMQHGLISCYAHSLRVARCSLILSRALKLRVDERSLVRGALLHDYFLYDWHEDDPSHKWHGFHHPAAALKNAQRDFTLSPRERDIILRHMFPLTPRPPVYRESWLVCLADKYCALIETFHRK